MLSQRIRYIYTVSETLNLEIIYISNDSEQEVQPEMEDLLDVYVNQLDEEQVQ